MAGIELQRNSTQALQTQDSLGIMYIEHNGMQRMTVMMVN